eukprot:TRINITY_DN13780_c0_g2_i2.p1 TRINITY_DN13780_c0_g2~~TRINITY_DN13780_c0_g2_i2.p1  ORF type:complete len:203 (-),score=44.33 TRINITY_DN13780_c0_g2_i2:690-1298(-)
MNVESAEEDARRQDDREGTDARKVEKEGGGRSKRNCPGTRDDDDISPTHSKFKSTACYLERNRLLGLGEALGQDGSLGRLPLKTNGPGRDGLNRSDMIIDYKQQLGHKLWFIDAEARREEEDQEGDASNAPQQPKRSNKPMSEESSTSEEELSSGRRSFFDRNDEKKKNGREFDGHGRGRQVPPGRGVCRGEGSISAHTHSE